MTVRNCGEETTVFQEPERIMTVGNIAVNLLYAAGAAERIVIRAGPHDGPLGGEVAAAVEAVEVFDDDDPSSETIIGADVDTVVATTACQPDGTWQQVFDEVERLGQLVGTEDEARAAVEEMRERVAAVEADSEGAPAQTAATVYYFGETLSINGNKNITQAMMDSLGLTHVFADLDEDFVEGSLEQVIDANPEVIILPCGWIDGQETFEEARQRLVRVSTPGMADVRAVADDRIVGIPAYHAQNDPRAVDGLEEVAEQLGRSG